jgi:hypothetical protein
MRLEGVETPAPLPRFVGGGEATDAVSVGAKPPTKSRSAHPYPTLSPLMNFLSARTGVVVGLGLPGARS